MAFDLRVLARGRRWAVIAKPSGLSCHRSALCRDRDTVAARARRRFGMPVHLVHRLDRAVSGCLVVAFDAEAAAALHGALRSPDAHKTYVAQVRGWWRWDDPFDITAPMAEADGTAKAARTHVRALGRANVPRASLIEASPRTGRFHQIRRHLRDVDHPILGDATHGDTRENRTWRGLGLPRLALHCAALHLDGPDGERIHAACPLPRDLAPLWQAQPWWSDAVEAAPYLARPPIRLDDLPRMLPRPTR